MGKTFRHTHRDADDDHDERIRERQQRATDKRQRAAEFMMAGHDAMPQHYRYEDTGYERQQFKTDPTFPQFKAARR